tara:strand:+ start:4146 stop:4439 length:294 start_codon:yes stop_codon:yes gene_type:complete
MKRFLYIVLSHTLLFHIAIRANDTFSVEIEALTLVMEKLYKDIDEDKIFSKQKQSYMAFKQDECNAKVEVTEKDGIQITSKESFDVNICKKEILRIK